MVRERRRNVKGLRESSEELLEVKGHRHQDLDHARFLKDLLESDLGYETRSLLCNITASLVKSCKSIVPPNKGHARLRCLYQQPWTDGGGNRIMVPFLCLPYWYYYQYNDYIVPKLCGPSQWSCLAPLLIVL